jgi:DNA-binding FrmR family transcriptional regulator
MAHTKKDKEKRLNRVNRISGQLNAIEKAPEGDDDCSRVLQTIAACRGAVNGLTAEVLEARAIPRDLRQLRLRIRDDGRSPHWRMPGPLEAASGMRTYCWNQG